MPIPDDPGEGTKSGNAWLLQALDIKFAEQERASGGPWDIFILSPIGFKRLIF